ncbi:MAG: hypothetical protein COA44_07725 [Arcobacter sp.]|nr:MAG: hypothetical protein COA44_07725 [Arcobacter sp.]
MLYLVGFFILFIIILIVITIMVFKKSKPEACKIESELKKEKVISLDMLLKTVKSSKSDLAEMQKALCVMGQKFPFPENEDEANPYFEFVYFFAKHPSSTAKLIVKMQKELALQNTKYKKQIEDFQMRGVEARK